MTDQMLYPVPLYDELVLEDLYDDHDGRRTGMRVRRVGSVYIEIEEMAFNLRVLLTDALAPLSYEQGLYERFGIGWCYDKAHGYDKVMRWVIEWRFDPRTLNHPPGPWIKAIHSGVYREPGIGQVGPDGITCPQCGMTSHHPKDVSEKYCGNCHQFHEFMGAGPE